MHTGPDVYLEQLEVFANHLVLGERREGLVQLRVINQQTQEEHYLDFGEPAYDAGISVNADFNTNILRFGYSSLTTPGSTFDYNLDTREKTLLKQQGSTR